MHTTYNTIQGATGTIVKSTSDTIEVTQGWTDDSKTVPLVTFINTSQAGTEYERWSVTQVTSKEDIQAIIDTLQRAL